MGSLPRMSDSAAIPTLSPTSLIYWEQPLVTAPLFGSILAVLFSLAFSSLLSVISYTALMLLTAVAAVKVYAFVMGKMDASFDPLAVAASMPLSLPESAIKEHAPCVTSIINQALAKAKSLFLLEIPVDTLKSGLCLYVLTYVGAWFNALTLVILSWIGVFPLPKLYLNNQAAVDEVVGKVAGQVNEVKAKVVEALPANMKPKIGVKEE